ncbi:MAG: lamin tail domain-containing protein, partial [Intrasporangiaceae bacterium]|nr:lamin tail domain-containing protein [Intrasporangiaceae bacterium]
MSIRSGVRRSCAALAAGGLAATGLVVTAGPAQAAGTTLVINEVYGGGGNSGATYTNDFVELFNGTGAEIDLQGYRVEYYSAAGNLGNSCPIGGTVPAGATFLIQQGAGAGGTTALPKPDAVCSANMSATRGSVRLFDAAGEIVDTVGYGAVELFEGAPGPEL